MLAAAPARQQSARRCEGRAVERAVRLDHRREDRAVGEVEGSLAALHAANITCRCPRGSRPQSHLRRSKGVAKAKLETPLTARAKPAPAPRRRKPVDRATVAEVFRRFRAANPEPKGELEHVNPYTLLVAVVLSAQSTDAGVNKATRELFRLADTPQKMLALGEDGVRDHIKTLNFLNTKARNVVALSRRLVEEHGGKVPSSIEVLQTLPGVGRKSASVVANIAFGEPRIAVDTHIFRVANRIPLVATDNPLDTQDAARAHRARGVPAQRAPLADPARALRLQGAPPGVLALPDPRSLPLRAEDAGAG